MKLIDKILNPIFALFLAVLFCACHSDHPANIQVTNPVDYVKYLNPDYQKQKLNALDKQIDFWKEKYQQDPRGFIFLDKMAGLYIKKFRSSGKIENVYASDSLYAKSLSITTGKNKTVAYQGLSQNAILKHQFKNALDYADSAHDFGIDEKSGLLLKFDALMELGDTVFSNQLMTAYGKRTDFDFLTRKSKYLDQIGNLDSAIIVMEVASSRSNASNNTSMICWSLSNLGDMYMHAGRVEESYNAYLNVLELDPAYHYALKGIAWLAYSSDNRPQEAIRILNFLSEVNELPDAYLTLAEINEYMGREEMANQLYEKFYSLSSDEKYIGMYNKYRILLNLERFKNFEEALRLSLEEQTNRQTPEVFDLLAWTYFNMGDHDKSYQISQKFVMNKSFEPELMFHTGKILNQRKMFDTAKKYLSEVLESKVEIGPVLYTEAIKSLN